jgi:hypothetical protein
MRYIDILRTRDMAIKVKFLNQLPDDILDSVEKPLQDAFKEGSLTWAKEHLPILVGEKEAELNGIVGKDFRSTTCCTANGSARDTK